MVDDVLLGKAASLERCLTRIAEEYHGHEAELTINFTRQDAIILNLQRACEAVIAMAMHAVRMRGLGVPQESREAFQLLREAGLVDSDLQSRMQAMVGFRNIAMHDYRKLDMDIVRSILDNQLDDFRRFSRAMLTQAMPNTDPSS